MENSNNLKTIITILTFAACLTALSFPADAQPENKSLRNGAKLYKKGQFDKALPEFQNAVQQNPKNPIANYDLASAQYRNKDYPSAEKTFDAAIATATADSLRQKANYNKGVSLSRQQKLLESIDAYKNAVKMNPADEDVRFNLQKALS